MRCLLPFLFVSAVACGDKDGSDSGGDSGGIDCDTSAAASVQVRVESEAGEDLSDQATVTYSVDGVETPCDGPYDSQFVCGWEVAGPIVISVSAEGYETAEETVVVESDVCHVITTSTTVQLVAAGD
jgi:hypothetical protein